MKPTIALLVPCFNAQGFVESICGDIAEQTDPFDEVIFFDDASTDNTASLIESHGYRVIRGKVNSNGPSAPRNALLRASSSDFVHFHDIDDPIHKEFVSKMRPELNSNTVYMCGFVKVSDITGLIEYSTPNKIQLDSDSVSYFIKTFHHINATIFPNNKDDVVFSESLELYEDKLVLIVLAALGYKFRIVPEVLATWNIRTGSQMTSRSWRDANKAFVSFLYLLPNLTKSQAHNVIEYAINKAWQSYYESRMRFFIREIEKSLIHILKEKQIYTRSEGALFNFFLSKFGLEFALIAKMIWSDLRHGLSKTRSG